MKQIDKRHKTCIVADPAKGVIKYSFDEFTKHWTNTGNSTGKGIVMFLEPTGNLLKHKSNKTYSLKNNSKALALILKYVNIHKRKFAYISFGLILGCIFQLAIPFLTQSIVDVGIKTKSIGFIWLVLIGETMIVLARLFSDVIRRRILLHISMHINISMLSDFIIKLLKLPMSFFSEKTLGDLQQRMNDHDRLQLFLTSSFLNFIFALLTFIVFSIVLLIYNKIIFSIYIVGGVLYAGYMSLFLKRRRLLDFQLFGLMAQNNSCTIELLANAQEIKLQDCETRKRHEWEDIQADSYKVRLKSLQLQQTMEIGSAFINEMKNIFITVISATSVISGSLSLGGMMAIQYVIGQLNAPLDNLMSFIYSFQDVKLSLERIHEIHQREDEDIDIDKQLQYYKNKNADIVIDKLTFSYERNSTIKAIDSISFTIPLHKTTAIVGNSGSGKTTLVKLLLGYYAPSSGSIFIGGENFSVFNKKWWRNQIGVVMQGGAIFAETIARNIATSGKSINEDRMRYAAHMACIDEYIDKLPFRYQTILGRDGIGLSEGQKQRILIARAIYRNPDFIIFDEATNSLDASTEHCIVNNLNKFMKNKTCVIVAHRLSTVKNADNIIVMEKGQIKEQGTHEQLIELNGIYYNLIKNQLELG